MSRRHYNLPPLTTLSAFEAAARHLSFKNAAQELSVTPGAISHQIKALEGDLGTALFQRHHRGVGLTPEGQALFETLASSFGRISKRLATIRQNQSIEKVTVGSTTAVAALWLSPAIIRFWRDYPDLNINQMSQDGPFAARADLDFVIRYGRDRNATLTHTPLYRDELVPVGTPEVAKALAGISLDDLAQKRLIHLESDGQNWTTWTDWFQKLRYTGDLAMGSSVTSYSVALQLAQKGAGLALGWRRLVQPLLRAGKLATIGPHTLPAPHQFYLVEFSDGALSANANQLKDWILTEVHEGSV
jgi:DNA-binding transcriptional LysR family regulator